MCVDTRGRDIIVMKNIVALVKKSTSYLLNPEYGWESCVYEIENFRLILKLKYANRSFIDVLVVEYRLNHNIAYIVSYDYISGTINQVDDIIRFINETPLRDEVRGLTSYLKRGTSNEKIKNLEKKPKM